MNNLSVTPEHALAHGPRLSIQDNQDRTGTVRFSIQYRSFAYGVVFKKLILK